MSSHDIAMILVVSLPWGSLCTPVRAALAALAFTVHTDLEVKTRTSELVRNVHSARQVRYRLLPGI